MYVSSGQYCVGAALGGNRDDLEAKCSAMGACMVHVKSAADQANLEAALRNVVSVSHVEIH